MKEQILNDEELITMMREVKAVIDSRTISNDSCDLSPVTLNHRIFREGSVVISNFDSE